ncbi:MAG: hypothetical protein AAFQ36_11615 [Pseudomonadota bacterium]
MKLCIVIPRDEWRATAGVRIRYDRLVEPLRARGIEMELRSIDAFRANAASVADVFLISKCYDARSVALARLLTQSGRPVGIDFFDDYFSQTTDARFVHLRNWLRELRPYLSFALCSTPKMKAQIEPIVDGLSVQVINDPMAGLDTAALGKTLSRKLAETKRTHRLKLGWFGIGDNPHFQVGLDDVFAYADALTTLRNAGYQVELSMLTNTRALTPARLERLSRLPITPHIEEWSETAEARLTRDSLVCLLPVNAQGFSTVKSLNRAITALVGGAQVLSLGFPLYEPLSRHIYGSVAELMADLSAGRIRHSKGKLDDLARTLSEIGSADREADTVASVLKAAQPVPVAKAGVGVVLHGVQSTVAVQKGVQRLGCVSALSPLTAGKLAADVVPRFDIGGVVLEITERAAKHVSENYRDRLREIENRNGVLIYDLRLDPNEVAVSHEVPEQTRPPFMTRDFARYGRDMRLTERVLAQVFGDDVAVIRSEVRSPYHTAEGSHAR